MLFLLTAFALESECKVTKNYRTDKNYFLPCLGIGVFLQSENVIIMTDLEKRGVEGGNGARSAELRAVSMEGGNGGRRPELRAGLIPFYVQRPFL